MKKFIIILVLSLFITSNIFPQINGADIIYNSNQFGLINFQSFKRINSGKKDIYIQLGVNFINTQNESGRYLKLNKSNTSWYIPANGFIGAAWGQEFPMGSLECRPVSFFAISMKDTNLLIKFQITPGTSCPDAKSYYTTNGGLNWNLAPFSCGGAILYPFGGDYNPKKDSSLLFGYGNLFPGGIFQSKNGGTNWQNIYSIQEIRQIESYNPLYNGYGFLKYNPFDTSYVYVNGYFNLLLSTNCGYGFDTTNVKWVRNIIFSYKDSIIYGFNDYKLYRSNNKGFSWDSIQTSVKFTSLEVNPDSSNILYAGDSNGVYRTTNYGMNWTLYNNTFTPSKIIIGISKDAGTGDTFYVATNKCVYKVWASFLVNVENKNLSLPLKYSLSQNYPNPFNPSTNIKYRVPSGSITNNKFVMLKVYDILGKEVATLVNEKQSPGTYEVQFPNSQLTNVQLPSGIYFYSLFADGNLIETKKMILLK
jgi:hypothetical protein